MKSPAADAAERWSRYRKPKVEWCEMNDDASVAGGNSLAQPVNPSSSSDQPRAPLQDDGDKDELVRTLRAENKDRFAKHAFCILALFLTRTQIRRKLHLVVFPLTRPLVLKLLRAFTRNPLPIRRLVGQTLPSLWTFSNALTF